MAKANNYLLDGRKRPYDAYVVLTLKCNSKCDHCYIEAGPERTESMPMELRKKVIDEAAKHNIRRITFSGGEPTVEMEKLIDTLEYASETRKKTGYPDIILLQSNVYFLIGLSENEIEKELAKLKSAGVTELDIASDDPYHKIATDELDRIEKTAETVFGKPNVSRRPGDLCVAPIGRARTKIHNKHWYRGRFDRHGNYCYVTISSNGDVHQCCWQPNPMGNLSEEPLKNILERARKPGSIFRKIAKDGFAGLEPEEDLGISTEEFGKLMDEFGECGACHQYFKERKNVQK